MPIPAGALDLLPLIPATAIVVWGVLRILHGPVGRALAERIRGRGNADHDQVTQLRGEVLALRADLRDTQDRLDVTRRALAEDIQRQRAAAPV